MKYSVYVIRDLKVGFMSPTVDHNDASAIRNFEHAVKNTSSLMNSHPEDYTLYRIGEFDSESGMIDGYQPVHIYSAIDMK